MSAITPPMIYACLQKIEERGAHEMARRALQMCGQVFRYAVVTGRADTDMTRDLKGSLKNLHGVTLLRLKLMNYLHSSKK